MYFSTDGGAALPPGLRKGKFANFHWIPDTGHEDQVYLKNLCFVATTFAGMRFSELHGAKTERGHELLKNAWDLHKARDNLLGVLRPAYGQAIARVFLRTQPLNATPTFEGMHDTQTLFFRRSRLLRRKKKYVCLYVHMYVCM